MWPFLFPGLAQDAPCLNINNSSLAQDIMIRAWRRMRGPSAVSHTAQSVVKVPPATPFVARVRLAITEDHSKWDQILSVEMVKYIGFCVYRRSYLLWFPIIVGD